MFKKIALALAVLLTASSAWAFETFPKWDPTSLGAGQTAYQILDAGGVSTFSNALKISNTAGIIVSFDPDRLTAGGASVILLYHCPDDDDANAGTRCVLLASLSSQVMGDYYAVTDGYLRTYKSTAPAGAVEAKVTIKSLAGSAGGGGAGNTWFSALSLFDPKMSSAINQATYEWHHWSMKDDIGNAYSSIGVDTWANLFNASTGTCPSGLWHQGLQFVYDFGNGEGCDTGPGGGTHHGALCACADKDGSGYIQAYPDASVAQTHMWSQAWTALGGESIGHYATDIQFVGYPKPLLRFDVPNALSCATTEEVNHPLQLQPRDNPVFYAEVVPWNYSAQLANMSATMAATIAFVGWKVDDVATATPGFNFYLDPAVAGVNTLIEAELIDALGFLWVDSKWYFVMVKDSVIVQSDLVLDPVATYGSLLTFASAHTGGSIGLMVQTDVDQQGGNRRRGAYVVDPYNNSTYAHTTFVPFPVGNANAGPDSGFYDAGGQGKYWHRIISVCQNASGTAFGRFFMSQMDVVK